MQYAIPVLTLLLFSGQDDASRQATKLVEKLRSDNIQDREEATVILSKMGKAAVLALEPVILDSDVEVALRAMIILRRIPAREHYLARRKRIGKPTASSSLKLAEYCIRKELYSEAMSEFEKSVRLADPQNAPDNVPTLRVTLKASLLRGVESMTDREEYQLALAVLSLVRSSFHDQLSSRESERLDIRKKRLREKAILKRITEKLEEGSASVSPLLRD